MEYTNLKADIEGLKNKLENRMIECFKLGIDPFEDVKILGIQEEINLIRMQIYA